MPLHDDVPPGRGFWYRDPRRPRRTWTFPATWLRRKVARLLQAKGHFAWISSTIAALRRPADIAASGIVVIVAAVQVALLAAPVVGVELVTAGLYIGLRAGASWRQTLREERDEAHAMVDRWNHADTHYALDEVGSITPERRPPEPVERYDPDHEMPLCSWCPEPTPATARIDLPGLHNAPACDEHVQAARFGQVTADTAYPDTAATFTRLQ